MVHEAVGAVGGCTCVAHPAPVRRQAATQPFDVRDDVAPAVGRGGVAVKEDDRLARAGVYVGDLGLEQGDSVTLVRIGGRNGFAHAFASCRSFPPPWTSAERLGALLKLYSPNRVEGSFCELRLEGVLGSSLEAGRRKR